MKAFLGGTCNGSQWRDALIKLLEIDYFNPVVDDWTPQCLAQEIAERESADLVLYVLTPKMIGVYTVAEVVDDSNKRPQKTVLCILPSDIDDDGLRIEFGAAQSESLEAVKSLVAKNGARVLNTLEEVASYLNQNESGT